MIVIIKIVSISWKYWSSHSLEIETLEKQCGFSKLYFFRIFALVTTATDFKLGKQVNTVLDSLFVARRRLVKKN